MKKNLVTLLVLVVGFHFFGCDREEAQPNLLITDITPVTGPKATVVTLTGTGFSQNVSDNIVTLNDKTCEVTAVTSTSLTVAIPARAGSGNLMVTVSGGKSAQSARFEYLYTQTVSTLAGSTSGYVDATGTSAQFQGLVDLVMDGRGNLLATEYLNNKIRKISASGVVTTFGDGNGSLRGLAFDKDGNLFVADDHKIHKITPAGVVSTFAGSTSGFAEGTGTDAKFNEPVGLAFDNDENLFVIDFFNHRIRKITPDGVVTTFAGSNQGFADGTSTEALFNSPQDLAFDSDGNLFVADAGNNRIRRITPAGVVTTFAGGAQGYADGTGTEARFFAPRNIVIDKDDNLLIADSFNDRIRKITPLGVVSTFAGSTSGLVDGPGTEAKFRAPWGLALDNDGNLFVADATNHRIRKIVSE